VASIPGRRRSGIGIVHGPRLSLSPRLVVLIAIPLVLLALYLLVALAMVYLATRPDPAPKQASRLQLWAGAWRSISLLDSQALSQAFRCGSGRVRCYSC
jgi:hypothetical protein